MGLSYFRELDDAQIMLEEKIQTLLEREKTLFDNDKITVTQVLDDFGLEKSSIPLVNSWLWDLVDKGVLRSRGPGRDGQYTFSLA